MSDVWIPSDEEYNEMCRHCKNNIINALKLFKEWIDSTRQSRPICKETFCPTDSRKSRQVPLVLAANAGNAHIVRYLLTEYSDVIDVNCKGDIGRHVGAHGTGIPNKFHNGGVTALWAACCWGYREIVQLLIRAGADVNAASDDNSTPMEIAAFTGHCEIMELLYSHGADVNMRNNQHCSPLMAAANTNQVVAVIFLLEHNADVSLRNAQGYTVFHVAVASGSLDVIRTLKRKGFVPNFELPQLGVIPCPYFIAVGFGYHEIEDELKQTHIYTKEYMSEKYLMKGARYVTKRQHSLPVLKILECWRKAVRLRNTCGYVPKFLPSSDVYAGLSEIVTEEDLAGPSKDSGLDMETWVRYQSLLIKERIVGPPFILQTLLDMGNIMCDKKIFRHAELLWLQFIKYCPLLPTDTFTGNKMPNYRSCMYEFAWGIHKMVLEQYQPDFSKFIQFGLRLLSKMIFLDVAILQLILWIFISWIRSDSCDGEDEFYSDECEELGRELVSEQFHITDKMTLLHLAVSNFKIHHQNAHVLFAPHYQQLVLALLRWGCDQDLYSVRSHIHPIHVAVRVGNEHHIDIVTPLLKYGCSPLFVDTKGQTALQLATSDVMLCALRPYSLSLFSLCCVAIVRHELPYESLELPIVVKNHIRLFDRYA